MFYSFLSSSSIKTQSAESGRRSPEKEKSERVTYSKVFQAYGFVIQDSILTSSPLTERLHSFLLFSNCRILLGHKSRDRHKDIVLVVVVVFVISFQAHSWMQNLGVYDGDDDDVDDVPYFEPEIQEY
jgi:hypothetical protein